MRRAGIYFIAAIFAVSFMLQSDSFAGKAHKSNDEMKKELMEADRQFAKAAAAKGLDGWMEFMADDVIRVPKLGGTAIVGKAKVRESDASIFADPNVKLVWEPTDGGGFKDPSIGFTTGRFQVLKTQPDGKQLEISRGGYITWWKNQGNSNWRVILDTGAPDSAAVKPSPATPSNTKR